MLWTTRRFALAALAALSVLPCVAPAVAQTPRDGSDPAAETTSDRGPTFAPLRQVERLDRGLVAIPQDGGGAFLSWRMLGRDPEAVRFRLSRTTGDGPETVLHDEPLRDTWFVDEDWDSAAETIWRVEAVGPGLEGDLGGTFRRPAGAALRPYLSVPLERPGDGVDRNGRPFGYTANDAAVADLDGDGDYEIVLRWEPTNTRGGGGGARPGGTGPVLIDALTLDGERLWRIDLGPNVAASAHIMQMTAYDLDGDDRGEVVLKTADGTVDGRGEVLGDPTADHRGRDGAILRGPEFLTVFDGRTGAALASTFFVPQRHPETDSPAGDQIWDVWGDDYGNRMDRFSACVAYLDGERPHLVTGRGYYSGRGGRGGRTCLAAWRWRDGRLEHVWTFDTLGRPDLAGYVGQGNHQVSVADLDGDGRDEIVLGACAIDDDGTGLYTTGLGHGDALHVTDMDPGRPGLEVFDIHEGEGHDAGMEFRAADGSAIWKKFPRRDVGRGVAFDVDPASPGFEFWSSGGPGVYDVHGDMIHPRKPRWTNMGLWWDGDLTRELLNGTIVDKWDPETGDEIRLVTGYREPYDGAANNGTKANPCLAADVLGDWREELILRSRDSSRLMIFVSTIPTPHRLRTLMHDPHYRVSVDWQNVGYNQSAHTGFYLGPGMPLPQPPFAVRYVR
ncbi:rhamnogalacturonan lyase [Alienimonas californiensis]|uniref:Rhamnogalacturonan endolyase YesW n=1 Tax=Alienimonas californiensis TaxID=2527989 RepID=A0A517PFP6_9PLAN|nr:rhamnogalacturonan lyase [Alienimonas californiensis]QDT18213.1 Rhamnogalacturonan endolyase YesW precursor [Alienimonas californiensis]